MQEDRVCGVSKVTPQACLDDARLGHFLDREFDGAGGLLNEFPLLMGTLNRSRRLVLEEEGELVAHAAWRPLGLRSGRERLRAAGIGLVTTHRARRGRGYATRLVQHCLEQARESGTELALLFAPSRSLYRGLGFVPAGRERVTPLATDADPHDTSARVRVGDRRDASELLRMLERHSLRVERTSGEFETLLATPGTYTYVLERDGRPVAYCIEGKGRDLRGVVHEWAGEPSGVAWLLRAVAKALGRSLCVLSPESEPAPLEGPSDLQPLAQVLILRPESFGSRDPAAVFGDAQTRARIPIYVWGLDSV